MNALLSVKARLDLPYILSLVMISTNATTVTGSQSQAMGHRSGQVGIRLSQLSTHSCQQHVGTRLETQQMFSHVRKIFKSTQNNPSQSTSSVMLISTGVVGSGLVEAMSTIQTPHAFPGCERLKANGTSGLVTNALLSHLRHQCVKKVSKNNQLT